MSVSISIAEAHVLHEFAIRLDEAHLSHRYMLEELRDDRLYEPETAHLLANVLEPGDTFIDIGGHIGYFGLLAASIVGDAGRVVVFEPERDNYARLLDNIALNRLTNILPVHMAVGAADGVADFYVNADNDGGHALWDVGEHPFNEATRSRRERRPMWVTTLDRFLSTAAAGRIKAIKIDTEGNELAVLQGARETLLRHRVPYVIAEINRFGLERVGASEGALRELMDSLGYAMYVMIPGATDLPRADLGVEIESEHIFNVVFELGR